MKSYYKFLLFLLAFIILIGLTNAELIVSPNPLNIQLEANIQKSIDINFTSRFNMTIYNITYQDPKYFTNIIIEELQPNQSVIRNITFLANTQVAETITPRVVFTYLGLLTDPPKVFNVNITTNGFSPQHLSIRQNDAITWFNSDNITRKVKHTGIPLSFEGTLASLNSYSYTFPIIGSYPYNDPSFPFHQGSINVVNASTQIPIRNANYDVQQTMIINSNFIQTNLLFELLQENFTVAYNAGTEGILKVTNAGNNQTAFNITLTSTSNWIIFIENKFNLNPQENNFVTFKIQPIISQASATNKTYTIPITVVGTNTASFTKNIQIYIPLENFVISNNTSKEDLIRRLNELAEIVKLLNLSNGSKEVIYLPSSLSVNLTEEEAKQLYRQLGSIDTILSNIEKRRGTDSDTINQMKNYLDEQIRLLNASQMEQAKTREKIDFQNAFALWSVILIIILVIVIFVAYQIRKKALNERRSLMK